jgi:hypothetical protein
MNSGSGLDSEVEKDESSHSDEGGRKENRIDRARAESS